VFSPAGKALAGKQVKIAGLIMPLESAARQKPFVLLAYPPGLPFHFHAMPNQFVEVFVDAPVGVNERHPMVIEGTLQLTGMDESGILFRLVRARKVRPPQRRRSRDAQRLCSRVLSNYPESGSSTGAKVKNKARSERTKQDRVGYKLAV
jgi:hypothetical protein